MSFFKTKTILLLSFFLPLIAKADGYAIPGEYHPPKLPTAGTYSAEALVGYIYTVIGALLAVSASVAVFFIFLSGFQLVTAMGNSEKIDQAKKTLFWAIGGLLIIILSFAIVHFIANLITNRIIE